MESYNECMLRQTYYKGRNDEHTYGIKDNPELTYEDWKNYLKDNREEFEEESKERTYTLEEMKKVYEQGVMYQRYITTDIPISTFDEFLKTL